MLDGGNVRPSPYLAPMATYRPFHLPECPARDGSVSLESCSCPLWRFLDPGSRLDESADAAGVEDCAP